jgi:acetyl/propionyl-CoA carboxylase alpha subunit
VNTSPERLCLIFLQGIHPGYGFLSENAKFVDMVEAAGIAIIGPTSGPKHPLGDKISSTKIAKDAGCFVIPGYEGEIRDEEHAVQLAKYAACCYCTAHKLPSLTTMSALVF